MHKAAPIAVHDPAASAADASTALTANRAEHKFALPRARVSRFLRAASAALPVHRFRGEGANLLPEAQQFVTSIYFDTPTRAHYRAAAGDGEHNIKLRAREYYDLQPSLAELATDASQIVRYQPWVWFEVKERSDGRSKKLRFRLPKREVAAFFRKEHDAFAEARSAWGDDLTHIVTYLEGLTEPLEPSCIVNYQRVALQDDVGALRVTVDLDVGFYAPPADLWSRTEALVRGTFGAPRKVESHALVEVKCLGAQPAWLERALAEVAAQPVAYSKFVQAARAVHG